MWEIFNTSAFAPFVIAGMVLVILLVVEMLGFFFGGMSGFLDNLLPDSLVDADFDADADISVHSDLSLGLRALDWLYVGRIPTMILLILFIASFCITGLLIQQVSLAILGNYISPWLASLDALVMSVPILKLLAALLYPILPKDESSAVTGDSLVGKPARILLGTASIGKPAQAKITDEYGQNHFVMVEPDPNYEQHASHAPLSTLHKTNLNHSLINQSLINPSLNDADDAMTITADDTLIITQKIGERYFVKKQ